MALGHLLGGISQRDPHVRRFSERKTGMWKLEICRHHADDGVVLFIQTQRLAHGTLLTAKAPLPQTVTENDYLVASRLIFISCDSSSVISLRAQQRKKIRRDARGRDAFGPFTSGQIQILIFEAGHLFEDLALRAVVFVLRSFGRQPLDAQFLKVAPDHHQAIGVLIRQRPQEDAIHNTEDRGVSSNAERQHQHHSEREARMLPQTRNPVAKVFQQIIHRSLLLVTQGHQRIDPRRTPRRDVARQQCYGCQHHGDSHKRYGISWAHSKKQTPNQTR